MKNLLYTLLLFFATTTGWAQTDNSEKELSVKKVKPIKSTNLDNQPQAFNYKDCFSTFKVCDIGIYNLLITTGEGIDTMEINKNYSCLGAGELNSFWLEVNTASDGLLGFSIIPNSTTDDFDWAVFNITNNICSDIFTDSTLEVSCNFSSSVTPNSITGPNGGSNPQDDSLIEVSAGERYVIVVSNFTSTNILFSIDFTSSTASFNTCNSVNESSIRATKAYPNPASNSIAITVPFNSKDNTIDIYNTSGQLVTTHANQSKGIANLNVEGLPTGLYTYHIITADGKTAAGRFVKQ